MRKFYFLSRGFACAALLTMSVGVNAQQLSNTGFEQWNSEAGSSECFGVPQWAEMGMSSPATGEMRKRPGIEPAAWNGSSVNQFVLMEVTKELVAKCAGVQGDAVALTNGFVGMMGIGSVAPGFITLGTPWVYAEADVSVCDGGTYGGVEFTWLPDAVMGQFRRTDDNAEQSHIIAYLWNGTFVSNVGPKERLGEDVEEEDQRKPEQPREDVERAVLGLIDADQKGTLLASVDFAFMPGKDWTTVVAPLEYNEEYWDEVSQVYTELPEKANIIVSAGEYSDRPAMVDGTQLQADNVRFVYFSRLKALVSSTGQIVDLSDVEFVDGQCEVDVPFSYSQLSYVARLGRQAEIPGAAAALAADDPSTITLTVTNENGEDVDGQSSHTYVLHFAEASDPEGEKYSGYLTVVMAGTSVLMEDAPADIYIIDKGEGKVDFSLPNFAIDLGDGPMPVGDILVPDVVVTESEGVKTYTGAVEGMKLLGGQLTADVVLNCTIDSHNTVNMDIDIKWITDDGFIPLTAKFSTEKSGIHSVLAPGADDNAPVEIYDLRGVRVDGSSLAPGLYIRKQGNKVNKVVVR